MSLPTPSRQIAVSEREQVTRLTPTTQPLHILLVSQYAVWSMSDGVCVVWLLLWPSGC
jgi:hypothetical protein